MHTDESILSSGRKIKFIAASMPYLLVLYVLSVGPVAKLEDYEMIGQRTDSVLNVIYAPLALLKPLPGMRPLLNWYIFHVWNCDTMGDNTL